MTLLPIKVVSLLPKRPLPRWLPRDEVPQLLCFFFPGRDSQYKVWVKEVQFDHFLVIKVEYPVLAFHPIPSPGPPSHGWF